MSVVAVAGGLGDLGRLITDALFATGKYEVYIMSRKSLIEELTAKHVKVVICAFIMDCDSASDAQLRLIRAAERSASVKRFVPSEFNVEYDVGDDVLPYPEKKYHILARRELAKTTSLEYAYVYPGMFMDYFGLPKVPSTLRPLCFFVDPEAGEAVLPGDGEARMSMTFTTDAARYLALALELDEWPANYILSTVASTVSLNELVSLIEKSLGRKLRVRYQPVENLLKHESIDLPTNLEIAKQYPERFPGGLDQFRALIADLEAGIALGAYDLGNLSDGHVDLVKAFEGKVPPPRRIEEVIEEAWGSGTRPYGFQEVLYNAISVPPGSHGLFLISSSVTFSYTPWSPRGDFHDLAPFLRNAWLQLRQEYPTLAAENLSNGKSYTSPSTPAELEAWLAATFIVTPGKNSTDLFRTMIKTRQMTLYFCPEERQLFLQGEHHLLDGRGLMNFWDRFFKALSSPMPEIMRRTDGSEIARLPPRSDDHLSVNEKHPGRGSQRALELLAPLATIEAPITMPVSRPFPQHSTQNCSQQLKAGVHITKAITAACKTQKLSVTATWHAAAVLATQSIQAAAAAVAPLRTAAIPGIPKVGTQFACFGNFDLRRYFPQDAVTQDIAALSNHHGVLPYVLSLSEGDKAKSFAELARELAAWYQQDLAKADPEVWSALGPMIKMILPEFTRDQLEETAPALSSFGVVDSFIKSIYKGKGGLWRVEDVWFGDTVTGPWIEHFVWSWQGRLCLNSCYNPAYYTRPEVENFNQLVLDKILEGLGIVSQGKL
ncbi:hypothetical protein QBC35DRAFT_518708 [Podospora australis]|uniref:NmrA-like domain-containing protein n=1 Tax=Podospora australis TaxID=1536484 RepID=A0AAN7AE97_9PEZI|nr:hypothetical protein QBC35DRAFT_518708 [Podospora australis]